MERGAVFSMARGFESSNEGRASCCLDLGGVEGGPEDLV